MAKTISEKAFYFNNRQNNKLFGFYHRPAQKSDKKIAILICHPLFEERVFAYRFLVNFAREACYHGYHVLRFDYYGYGDSSGDVVDATVSSILRDIEDAYNVLREQSAVSHVCLLGLRFGATLAGLFASNFRNPSVLSLILWEPIIDPPQYINKALRQAISIQTVIFKKIELRREDILRNLLSNRPSILEGYNLASIDGYPLTKEFFQELKVIDIEDLLTLPNESLFVFFKKPKRPLEAQKIKFQEKLLNCAKKFTISTVEESVDFWRDNKIFKNSSPEIFRRTLTWLEKDLSINDARRDSKFPK